MPAPRRSFANILASVALPPCLCLFGCNSGGDSVDILIVGHNEGEASTLTTSTKITDETGSSSVDTSFLYTTSNGEIIFFDDLSRCVVLVNEDGEPTVLASQTDLTDATGETPALLGRCDEIGEGGALAGHFVFADSVSGLLVRVEPDGTVSVHVAESDITATTGEATATLARPRSLAYNLVTDLDVVMAQDMVSRHILRIDDVAATVTIFVDKTSLASASGLAADDAVVSGWTRGPVSGTHFCWFDDSAALVGVPGSGTAFTHVTSSTLDGLFPEVTTLRIIEVVANSR